jgi:hypothetical protein
MKAHRIIVCRTAAPSACIADITDHAIGGVTLTEGTVAQIACQYSRKMITVADATALSHCRHNGTVGLPQLGAHSRCGPRSSVNVASTQYIATGALSLMQVTEGVIAARGRPATGSSDTGIRCRKMRKIRWIFYLIERKTLCYAPKIILSFGNCRRLLER